jgi:hypothetical protein
MISLLLVLVWHLTKTEAEKKLSQQQKEQIYQQMFERRWFNVSLWRVVVFYILFGGVLIFLQVQDDLQELPSPLSHIYTGYSFE